MTESLGSGNGATWLDCFFASERPMNKPSLFFACALATAIAGCSPSTSNDTSAVSASTGARAPFIQRLDNPSDFFEYAGKIGGSSALKYTIQTKESGLPIYYQNTAKYPFHAEFLTDTFPKYANMSFEEYSRYIFGGENGEGRELAAGSLIYSDTYQLTPTSPNGTIAFEYYMGKEGSSLTADVALRNVDNIVMIRDRLAATIPFIQGRIAVLLPSSIRFTSSKVVQALKAKGVQVLWDTPNLRKAFFGTGDIVAYHPAVSYGYLKAMSREDVAAGNYTSKDILLLDDIPLDLGPVSGIITSIPQVPLSHIMLRAVNQNVPDVFVLGAEDRREIQANLGKLVQLTVQPDNSFTVKGADDLPDIEQRATEYFANRVRPLPPLEADLSVTAFLRWSAQAFQPSAVKSYGAKGANFASLDLALRKTGVDRRDYDGSFLIPFSAYRDHVQGRLTAQLCEKAAKSCNNELNVPCEEAAQLCTTFAGQSKTIEEAVEQTTSDRNVMSDTSRRRQRLAFARALIEKADASPTLLDTLETTILAHYSANTRIRFRSSTNAEDLPGLNGAGLYESKSGCIQDDLDAANGVAADQGSACRTPLETQRILKRLSELDPARDKVTIEALKKDLRQKFPLANAVRKVFASLWTDRAFITRDYYNIDHTKVFMGILAHPAFVDESANGVLAISDAPTGHSIWASCQTEDISITNPAVRGASPETFTVTRAADGSLGSVAYSRKSSIIPGQVLSNEQIASLAAQAAVVHEDQKANLAAKFTGKTDIEFIVDANGSVRIKQARPFPKAEPLRPDGE
jgi:hypothetical protein